MGEGTVVGMVTKPSAPGGNRIHCMTGMDIIMGG